ncbi:MAG: T9SS type A sorting domain-containing protein [Candidatus Cloacimonetes bacterium]|nr:T9SS type A sorting domain-containing protein [Candidatus Cloacimonadota bacterium]
MKQKMMFLVLILVFIGNLWSQYTGTGDFHKLAFNEEVVTGYYVIGAVRPTNFVGDGFTNLAGVYAMGSNLGGTGTGTWVQGYYVSDDLQESMISDPVVANVHFIEKNEGTGQFTIKRVSDYWFLNYISAGTTGVNYSESSGVDTNWTITGVETGNTSPFLIQSVTGGANRQLRFRAELNPPRFNAVGATQGNSHAITLFRLATDPPVLPVITDFTPITVAPLANQALTISADVLYEGVLNSVTLRYFRNGVETNIAMNQSGNTFTTIIPANQLTDGARFEMNVVVLYDTDKTLESAQRRFFSGVTPIITMRTRTGNTTADLTYAGYVFKVQGVALMNDRIMHSLRNEFFIQDETAGIGIFRVNADALDLPDIEGRIIEVTGAIEAFNQLIQINANIVNNGNITVLGHGVLPNPVINTAEFFNDPINRELYAGQLIGISNVNKVSGGVWPQTVTGNIILTDGTDEIALRVFQASDAIGEANEPVWSVDISGVLGYSWTTANPVGNQILLRGLRDVHPLGVLPVTLTHFTAAELSNNTVQISWRTESEVNMSGYRLYRSESNMFDTAVQITGLFPAYNLPTTQNYEYIDSDVTKGHEYFYWLRAIENDGSSLMYGPANITISGTPITPPDELIYTTLSSVYPNPVRVNDLPNVDISVKSAETATLRIYNIRGQLVREYRDITGNETVTWDRRDMNNRETAAGVYFFQLSSPSYFSVQRMVVVR